MSTPQRMTADALLTHDARGHRTELVRGRLVVREPASYRHGAAAACVLARLAAWLEADRAQRHAPHPRGELLAADTGFMLQRAPDTVRAPDVAFVSWEHRPTVTRGFPDMAPDLAVELLSPDDRPAAVLAKVADWLGAGTSLVWTIDVERRAAAVYRADGSITVVAEHESLDGASLLPGLRIALAALLD